MAHKKLSDREFADLRIGQIIERLDEKKAIPEGSYGEVKRIFSFLEMNGATWLSQWMEQLVSDGSLDGFYIDDRVPVRTSKPSNWADAVTKKQFYKDVEALNKALKSRGARPRGRAGRRNNGRSARPLARLANTLRR